MKASVLEEISNFTKYEQPSRKFLRYAAQLLSDEKSDTNHNPSFKSCLVRIPNSINSKNGEVVKIIQEWDRNRPKIVLLGRFYAYLHGIEMREEKSRKQYVNNNTDSNGIGWIESLMQTPIDDGRKIISSLILVPYLCNIKKLAYEDVCSMIKGWLSKCNEVRRLDFNIEYFVKDRVKHASGYKPMKLDTLKDRYPDLFYKTRVPETK